MTQELFLANIAIEKLVENVSHGFTHPNAIYIRSSRIVLKKVWELNDFEMTNDLTCIIHINDWDQHNH